jgi:GNAT superfamily N-acetyltransferase
MSTDVSAEAIEYRQLRPAELSFVADIDRTEHIEAIYLQHGTHLELRAGAFSARSWDAEGAGEHSVAGQRAALERQVVAGAIPLGAFEGSRLVGIGLVTLHVRPATAQLAYLHVSHGYRALGIGGRLSDELERIAREAGDTSMVVSATPSVNTVRFYQARGFEPMAEPFPELYELEPEDVHLQKLLGSS